MIIIIMLVTIWVIIIMAREIFHAFNSPKTSILSENRVCFELIRRGVQSLWGTIFSAK